METQLLFTKEGVKQSLMKYFRENNGRIKGYNTIEIYNNWSEDYNVIIDDNDVVYACKLIKKLAEIYRNAEE